MDILDTTPEVMAQWMLDSVMENGVLTQSGAALRIQEQFGNQFVYLNENDHLAIRPDILKVFREIRGDDVKWDRREKVWTSGTDTGDVLVESHDYSDLIPEIDPALLNDPGLEELLLNSNAEINKLLSNNDLNLEGLQ